MHFQYNVAPSAWTCKLQQLQAIAFLSPIPFGHDVYFVYEAFFPCAVLWSQGKNTDIKFQLNWTLGLLNVTAFHFILQSTAEDNFN